jgi:hypothetical protein
MKYYRLVFKKDNLGVSFSEISEQTIDDSTFSKMNWDKPIIRQFDGRYHHFISLHRDYLECILLGVGVYQELSSGI